MSGSSVFENMVNYSLYQSILIKLFFFFFFCFKSLFEGKHSNSNCAAVHRKEYLKDVVISFCYLMATHFTYWMCLGVSKPVSFTFDKMIVISRLHFDTSLNGCDQCYWGTKK